eukprot:CAMPEP_0182417476 /NCGR_PEP_ID=MMETSP1167-20130531/1966_1 /TAXON_ID=2988 /ORGANISM="Mallomonas Sp, Strain CCMP3275" /LENGTH=289 /DNA_ID=CAMNT_0024591091 /DNA_START=310 /DNA_END=1175 /DNA_ORIENTATION=+
MTDKDDMLDLNGASETENKKDNQNENPDDDFTGADIMESMCMSCGENGTTRLLLHKIPLFRELIIASFKCEECGYQNNEVTFGGSIQPKGCRYELEVTVSEDLNRQLIKSDSSSIRVPEIDFEIPPGTQRGAISTIEGFLSTASRSLSLFQAQRMKEQPEVGEKVAQIILSLSRMSRGEYLPFTVIVEDPAGNCFIENPHAPQRDNRLHHSIFTRSKEQDELLGLSESDTSYQADDTNYIELIEHGFGRERERNKEKERERERNEGVNEKDVNLLEKKEKEEGEREEEG